MRRTFRIWCLSLALLALPGCQPDDGGKATLGCAGPVVCVLVEAAQGELVLEVANDSGELVHVPWLNGAIAMTSGFSVKNVDQAVPEDVPATPTPTAIAMVGTTLLIPHARYGISISAADARELFRLEPGCQTVIAEFRATAPGDGVVSGLVTSARSQPTRICL